MSQDGENLELIDKVEENELTNEEQVKELSDEEKHELFVKQLKESKIKFRPIKQVGNKTINKYGTAFKKKRKVKNKLAKKSRKANRK
jgi:hypothetical protein